MSYVGQLIRWARGPRRRIGLWYHPEYEPPGVETLLPLIGLTPHRNEVMLRKLLSRKFLRESQIRSSPLATFEELRLIHPEKYLESVTNPETVSKIFGFEFGPVEVDQILRSQRRAVGGTIAAALAVMDNRVAVGVNLAGGYHHAEAARGMGFCILNDVAVAISSLRQTGFNGRIAVVDVDFHQGNGTRAIFAKDPYVLTYSLHGSVWDSSPAIADFEILLPPGCDDSIYLKKLRETLKRQLEEHRPELVFYVAGNDVLSGDRLGNFALSPDGILERDRHVVECVESLGARLIITLAGGYSPDSWRCTANLIAFLTTDSTTFKKDWEPDLRKRFTRIAGTLDATALGAEKEDTGNNPTEADILGDLSRMTRPRQLLDYYSANGIEFAFERYGILKKLRRQGFFDFQFDIDISDPERQILRLHARSSGEKSERKMLLELVASRTTRPAPPLSGIKGPLRLLDVKWLLLQDPDSAFRSDRPRLPGQSHPGLGIAEDIQEFLVQFCRRAKLDGVISTPSHYHNAAVASRAFRFLNPVMQGRLLAIKQVLLPYHLWDASRLVDAGALQLKNGTTLEWEPGEQVLPVSEKVKRYFAAGVYRLTAIAESQLLLGLGLQVAQPKEDRAASSCPMPVSKGFAIREATLADRELMAQVEADTWRETYHGTAQRDYGGSGLTRFAQSPERVCAFVAEDNKGRIVGFSIAGPERSGNLDYDGELYAIYVLPAYQGRGIGETLFLSAAQWLLARNYRSLALWTLKDNPFRMFYEGLGGKIISTRSIEASGTTHEEICFAWSVLDDLIPGNRVEAI